MAVNATSRFFSANIDFGFGTDSFIGAPTFSYPFSYRNL